MKKLSEWFRIDGDNTLRLDYPLDKDSMVWDVGGYHGDFAHNIIDRFGCSVTVFEPVEEFYKAIEERFKNNDHVLPVNFGLSNEFGWTKMSVAKDSSSTIKGNLTEEVAMADIGTIATEPVDLIKINIEGGEYALLNRLLDTGNINNFKYIQVQFHTFVEGADEKRNAIREKLKLTHKEMWNYNWVWESWERK